MLSDWQLGNNLTLRQEGDEFMFAYILHQEISAGSLMIKYVEMLKACAACMTRELFSASRKVQYI